MMRRVVISFLIAGFLCSMRVANAEEMGDRDALSFTMTTLDGRDVSLGTYRGKVLLIVNVASECGLTPQYEGLQELHEEYADQGLAVVAFPCNQFGGQEPGTADAIRQFCSDRYGVTFDLFAKIDVNGETACDLYKYLTAAETEPQSSGKISWNFEKFVIGRNGKVIGRFKPATTPNDPELLALIKAELANR